MSAFPCSVPFAQGRLPGGNQNPPTLIRLTLAARLCSRCGAIHHPDLNGFAFSTHNQG
jgi:hypothetical protein